MLDQKLFGEKLHNHRKRLGMTQEEIAAKVGVSAQAVSKWEAGNCFPDCFNLKAICNVYKISADVLLEIESDGDIEAAANKETTDIVCDKAQALGPPGAGKEFVDNPDCDKPIVIHARDDLEATVFRDNDLEGAVFKDNKISSKWSPAVFDGNSLSEAVFRDNDLEGAVFRDNKISSKWSPAVFDGNSLSGAVFSNNNMNETVFIDSDFDGTVFRNCSFRNIRFEDCQFDAIIADKDGNETSLK